MVQANGDGVVHDANSSSNAFVRHCSKSRRQTHSTQVRCPFCVVWFFYDDDMNRHVADSHGIIDNSCYLCKRQFPRVQELAQHLMEEHSVDRNLTCRLCGVTLKTKSQFVTHLSRHAEVKAFKCSYCEKAYYSATHLDRHKQSCFGIEHPFPCSCCDKYYKSQQSLKEHFDAVHRGKSFRCGFCGKVFIWRRKFRDHMKSCTASCHNSEDTEQVNIK